MSNDPLVRSLVKLLCQSLLRPAGLSATIMPRAAISSQATVFFTAIRVPVVT